MNISVYTVCYNEEKMLPHFLNYYTRIAEKITVWDNQSTDESVAIAKSYPGVEVKSFDTNGEFSELALTRIRNNCWRSDGADLAIVCDMDEFLYADNDLLVVLERSTEAIFHPVGFQMVSDAFPSNYGSLITEQVKLGVRDEAYSKKIAFRPRLVQDMRFGVGSHQAQPFGLFPLQVYESEMHGVNLKLLHYKNLGFEYRFAHNAAIGRRMKTWEYHPSGVVLGNHYLYDYERQMSEYLDLRSRSRQVIN